MPSSNDSLSPPKQALPPKVLQPAKAVLPPGNQSVKQVNLGGHFTLKKNPQKWRKMKFNNLRDFCNEIKITIP